MLRIITTGNHHNKNQTLFEDSQCVKLYVKCTMYVSSLIPHPQTNLHVTGEETKA